MELSDAELVKKCLDGEQAAFETLVSRYQTMVAGICFSMTRRHHVVADLAQESFIRAYKSLPKLREPEKFKNWIYGITRRTCIYWLRDLKEPAVSLEDVPENFFFLPHVETADEAALAKDLRELVMQTLETLPEKEREIIILRYLENKPYKELAETLGITASGVEARLRKAKSRLFFRVAKITGDLPPEITDKG